MMLMIIIIISNYHVPKFVETNREDKFTLLADRTSANNKPEIIISDNDKEHAF